VIEDVDPETRIDGGEEQDGTKRSPVNTARTPEAGYKREDAAGNPGKGAEVVAAHAAQ
jgi:hypothetical protein